MQGVSITRLKVTNSKTGRGCRVFTARVALKLREHHLLAGELSVFVHTDRFKDVPQYADSARLAVVLKAHSDVDSTCKSDMIRALASLAAPAAD
jgi:hypothetical protein